ncbi:MAG: DUF4340 domain-containing protein [Acidobacteria bacterium]|nr:DUF4340 domain-containing protein [Acidobacteriota bacterium]
MKKETILLIVAIVALGLYLGLRNRNRTHYTLPHFDKLKVEKIDRIVIKRKNESLTIKHHDDRWLIEPQGFKADENRLKKMASAMSGLKLTALAAESGETTRYNLDPDHAIRVTLYAGDKKVRDISIGKIASTYHHTYISLPGKKDVYLAAGNLRREFDISVDKLRDKIVLKVDKNAVTGIELHPKTGKPIILTKETTPVSVTPNPKGKTTASPAKKPKGPKWKTPDGRTALDGQVEQILTACTLNCDSFLPKAQLKTLKDPIFTLIFKGTEPATLKIYKQNKDGKYPAVSSKCDFPFLLSTWKVDRVKKSAGEILEKRKPKTKNTIKLKHTKIRPMA